MMKSFELSRYRRANVWLDEAPPAHFTATALMTRLVQPKVVVQASHRVVAVELSVPRGPRTSYALLGAELVDANVDGLEVVVPICKVGFPLKTSLALEADEVKVGLLDEYASAVSNGVVRVAASVGAPTKASLTFHWAAHGLAGSSPAVFEIACAMVLRLLSLPKDASEELLRALLDSL